MRSDKKVVIHLKTKYSTPRMYILNRLNDEMDKEIWWIENKYSMFRVRDGWYMYKDYVNKCVEAGKSEHIFKYFLQNAMSNSSMSSREIFIPDATTGMEEYAERRVDHFLSPGTIIEWMITMLLEGLDTHYISWVNDKTKLFQIFVPLQLLDVFNNANTYHRRPHISFAELRYTLKGYCMRDILIEVDARRFKYQFNEEWYNNEINNTHKMKR